MRGGHVTSFPMGSKSGMSVVTELGSLPQREENAQKKFRAAEGKVAPMEWSTSNTGTFR